MTDADREREALQNLIDRLPAAKLSTAGVYREAVHAPEVLNEATAYGSTFPRAITFEIPGFALMEISGTASIGPDGRTLYRGEFGAQAWRTFRNITVLLDQKGFSWMDVIRTRCYLRDIERDYVAFNAIRTEFYKAVGLVIPPASVGIQAILCRPDLLIEIEATAVRRVEP